MEDEKLSACCYTKSKEPLELVCPYETPLDRRPVKWTSAKIWCPVGTTKIMFICENYGREHGVCALDNIRVHREEDVKFQEPCQKNVLATL
ncbi:Protein Y53F4B.27 b [Aphelenchoides avenae]|nr:Protein Y53F4B.27 b [Aphelenchus avenae]